MKPRQLLAIVAIVIFALACSSATTPTPQPPPTATLSPTITPAPIATSSPIDATSRATAGPPEVATKPVSARTFSVLPKVPISDRSTTPTPVSTATPLPTQAPLATSVPTFTPAPTPTPLPTYTPVPTPTPPPTLTPLPTPDFDALVESCDLARARNSASRALMAGGYSADIAKTPVPFGQEVRACMEFKEQFPEAFARLIRNTITGTFTLVDDDFTGALGDVCLGSGGYRDINSSLDVVVKNGQGQIIATGDLGLGILKTRNTCVFAFQVYKVPDADFYDVEVGRRGSLVFSRSDLERTDWIVGFKLSSR